MSLPTEAASGPVTIATTGHVGLNVTDLSRSIRFYRDVFGFEVLADPDGTRVEVCTASGLDALPALDHGEPSCGFF